MTRTELLERYEALPLPTTKDEHWRFTDLAGFDPDGWTADGGAGIASAASMLDLEVSGLARVGESGIEIERAPDGVRFEPLADDHELLHSLVGWDEKFAAHNAALWRHGLLVHVPRGVVLEQPLYVRIANAVEGGSLFWRLLIVAEPESRFAVIEESSWRKLPAAALRGLANKGSPSTSRDLLSALNASWVRYTSPRTSMISGGLPFSTAGTSPLMVRRLRVTSSPSLPSPRVAPCTNLPVS